MSSSKPITTYELYARYLPALLTGLPIIILAFYLSKAVASKELIDYVFSLKFFGTISMSSVFLYFYAQLIRTTAKAFEKHYFMNKRGFPTTYFMLYSNPTYSEAFKQEFRRKVFDKFNISLFGKQDESRNPAEAIRLLNDTTKQIILLVGDGQLVGKHNQWYGFFRNLIGGCLYGGFCGIVSALLGEIVLHNRALVIGSLVPTLIYFGIFLARRAILVQHAEAYARQLIAEFISK
jgi:hypothetical protein